MSREDLEEEEYEEMRKDTLDQLKEFNNSLTAFQKGDMSLVDDLSRWQLVSYGGRGGRWQLVSYGGRGGRWQLVSYGGRGGGGSW